MKVSDIESIKKISNDKIDLMFNCFMFGYSQGIKACESGKPYNKRERSKFKPR